MEGICIIHSCIPLNTVYMQHSHSGGMQEWVIQIPSIPILVSVFFSIPTCRIMFVTSLYCFDAQEHENTLTSVYKLSHTPESVGCSVPFGFLPCPEVLNGWYLLFLSAGFVR